jgi:hypothetical protein
MHTSGHFHGPIGQEPLWVRLHVVDIMRMQRGQQHAGQLVGPLALEDDLAFALLAMPVDE